MHHFAYRDGVLHAEGVGLPDLASAVGTPFYCYSTATLTRHYRVFSAAFADADALVCYAMKANSNQAVLTLLAREGAGADVEQAHGSVSLHQVRVPWACASSGERATPSVLWMARLSLLAYCGSVA